MIALSIDPATHGCGVALWRDGKLIAAGYARNTVKDGDIVRRCAMAADAVLRWERQNRKPPIQGWAIDDLILELPQIYSRGANKTKGDPNKCVLPLAMVDAAIAAHFPAAEVVSYQPHAWKGGTSKPESASGPEYVIAQRVKARLSAEELAVVDWTESVSHSWDVADAIGVGLHHLGRFERKRVFARE